MKISVILPTYNRAYCITQALDSVIAQTFKDYEIIIIDDASTDNTEELITEYINSHSEVIRYHKLLQNSGVSAARNEGMRISEGEYIAFQDSDDYWYPEKLEKQMESISRFDADYCYTYIKKTVLQNDYMIPPRDIPISELSGKIYEQLLWNNTIGAPSLIMKRECFRTVGNFDSSFPANEDYDYVLRLSQNYNAAFIDEVLVDAGMSEEGISANPINYLVASCMLIGKYKNDLLKYNSFEHKVQEILDKSKMINAQDKFIKLLETILRNS